MSTCNNCKSPNIDVEFKWKEHTELTIQDLEISKNEREVLRKLAEKVALIAQSDQMKERCELWRRHNQLEKTRPLIFCDPEWGWNEIITNDQMECSSTLARRWEFDLRKEIFYAEQMGDDKPVTLNFDVPYTVSADDWGIQKEVHRTDLSGAISWDSPLTDYDKDLPKLHNPTFNIDWEVTNGTLQVAQEIFGDILNVRLKGTWWWSLGLSIRAIDFRHIDKLYMDMVMYPDAVKELFSILSKGLMSKLDYLEESGLLSLNNNYTYVGSGGYGFTNELPAEDFAGTVRCRDMWGFCESQETVGISPEMYEEFIHQYERPLMERFGLNCYGCCEPIDGRWDFVKNFPNLRRVSCSPWADIPKMAAYLEDKYIYSMKVSPTPLALPDFDQDRVRKELQSSFETTKDCRVECIMKDNHTLGGSAANAINWCRIAKEEARKYE